MNVPMLGKLPQWALWTAGAVGAYVVWKTITNPQKVGEAAGAAAVGVVTGTVKAAGGAVNGAINGVVQQVTGDESATLGGKLYEWWNKDELAALNEKIKLTPKYVPDAALKPQDNMTAFADLAGGGF